MNFELFQNIMTASDPAGGRALKVTLQTGVDDFNSYYTKSDPAGGRAIKIKIIDSYSGFLKLSGNVPLSTYLTTVVDGDNNASPLQLSTTNAYLPSGSFQIGDTSGSNYMYTLVGDSLSNSFNLKLPLITTNDTLAALNVPQIFTRGQTIRNSDGLRIENDANQDAIIISGNPRGTNNYAITLKPFDVGLNKSYTLRLPNISNDDTLAALSISQTFIAPQIIQSSLVLSATDSGSFLGLRAQTTNTVPTPSSGVNVFANASGQFGWVNSAGYTRSFGNPSVTTDLTFTLPSSSGTLALTNVAQTYSASGAASTAAITLTGTPFVGTGTTSVPLFYLNGGAAPTTWDNTASGGTYIGVNSIASFAGNYIDFRRNGGTSLFKVAGDGTTTLGMNSAVLNLGGNTVATLNIGTGGTNLAVSGGVLSLNGVTATNSWLLLNGTNANSRAFIQVCGSSAATTAPVSGTSIGSAPGAIIFYNSTTTNFVESFRIRGTGIINSPTLPNGNTGLASGDWYYDTAANVLANGDRVLARKS